MKRTMIAAAFALGLLAGSGANANTSVGKIDPTLSQAISVVRDLLSALSLTSASFGATGPQPPGDGRSAFNTAQRNAANLIEILSLVVSTELNTRAAVAGTIAATVSVTQNGYLQVTVTTVEGRNSIVSTTSAIVDFHGNIVSHSTIGPDSAGWSHSQNSSSGGSSRGDGGASSSESM